MRKGQRTLVSMVLVGSCVLFVSLRSGIGASGRGVSPVLPPAITNSSIGGVVTSSKGPEAGVWVIAETKDLPTGFRKIVVTDDQGRYVVPDLPKGSYKVWVRGYGLVDSKPVDAAPGRSVNLRAIVAPSPFAAAQYYPAAYWYSLLNIPDKSEFPMQNGPKTQEEWVHSMKGALQLIQIGDKTTRELPEALGKYDSSTEAWQALLNSGESPVSLSRLNQKRGLEMYSDWTDRIAAGEVPPAPPRPRGIERNAVITEWDWSTDKGFLHDEISTDRRHPTVNANGPIYGPEQFSGDVMNVLDPIRATAKRLAVPVRDTDLDLDYAAGAKAPLTWGNEIVRPGRANLHSPLMDSKGRVWLTAEFRRPENQPNFCKAGSTIASAKLFPIEKNVSSSGGRELMLYDPELRKFTFVDTCFGTHHMAFAEDLNNTLWLSGHDNEVLGWLNTKVFDETGDASKAQGWCPYVLDTNGNGKVDAYVGPNDPIDPAKDKRIVGGGYGIAVNPVDGTIWESGPADFSGPLNRSYPGFILRIDPGSNPPATCLTEIYNPPPGAFTPKGIDIDRSGMVWVSFAGSGHLASFDRRKCRIVNGPTATGDHCPEGWTLYPTPAPKFKNMGDQINSDWHYLNWVDQFDTLGLGKDVPLIMGTNSDSLLALMSRGEFMVLRVPYPLGFYSRGVDGRIDDPNAGWKGKGLWSSYASISPWHYEGGKGQVPKVVKFQIRPDPLAN